MTDRSDEQTALSGIECDRWSSAYDAAVASSAGLPNATSGEVHEWAVQVADMKIKALRKRS